MASSTICSPPAVLSVILLAFLTIILYFGVTKQVFCAALVAIIAWNVVVKTLELNDFRHRIKSSPLRGSRYIAALVATRLGLRDALVDWSVIYSIGYAIVAGFTWKDADPNSLLVLWGFSVMIAAMILGVLALRVPHWLGLYPKSGFNLISDTSNLAQPAVQNLVGTEEQPGGSITDFRYQIRVAFGSHFAKFSILLLPFYVGLKVWNFLASILMGCAFGYVYLFVIWYSRMRFEKHRGSVALWASAYMSVASSLIFMRGMDIANESWNLDFAEDNNLLMLLSFFGWLLICLLLQAASYYHFYTFKGNDPRQDTIARFTQDSRDDRASLFDDPLIIRDPAEELTESLECHLEPVLEDTEKNNKKDAEDSLDEPLICRRELYKKISMDDSSMSYFYHTGYFDPTNVRPDNELAERGARGSEVISSSSTDNYVSVVASESSQKEPIKWYSRVWLALPLKPFWDIFGLGCVRTFSCFDKEETDFKKSSCCDKFMFILSRTIGIFLNGCALYVALVACCATLQISRTKGKLPYVHETLYNNMNEDPVCAFDHKGGHIQTFSSQEKAHLSNYQVAHCGSCGHCSNWVDLELQWSTRKTLAQQSQKCAIRSITGGFDALQECLESPMIGGTHGFTEQCAKCWADDIVCTKKHCVFIYLQSRMTMKVGNFKVGPNDITSATCEEANCEAGNPGDFVYCVGANRRRMNIKSDIARPGDQQCTIVDVESWGEFFPPPN